MIDIDYVGHTLINFDDRSYRWIDIKRFAWNGVGDDDTVLAAIIGDRRYRDTYLSPDSHEQDAETVHGPYRVAEVTPSSFDRIEPVAAEDTVAEFCNLDQQPPQPKTRQLIESMVLSQLRRSTCYRLRRLKSAEHEFAFALWEFRELVAIARDPGQVLLVVMAID